MLAIQEEMDSNHKANKDNDRFLSQTLFSNKFKSYFFGFFGHLFKMKYSRKTKFQVQVVYEITLSIIVVLQLTSLTWHPKMNITNWESYMDFWQYIGFLSYDEICAEAHSMNFCFYGTLSLIGICYVTFAIFGVSIYADKEISARFTVVTRKIALLLTTVCFIPSTMIFLLVIKYSIVNTNDITEYSGSTKASELNYGPAGFIFGIVFLFSLVFINLSCESFCCDVKHSHQKYNIKSRSSVNLDLHRRIFYVFMCISYIIFAGYNIYIHQVIVSVYSFYLALQGILSLNYYNSIQNSIAAWKIASVMTSAIIFLFGQIIDNPAVIILFNIFAQPLVLLIVIRLVQLYTKHLPNFASNPKNQFEFERKYRHLLTNENLAEKSKVLTHFKNFAKLSTFEKNKLFVIWEFNFCVFVVKDERLARIKLAKIKQFKSSFEGEVQEWRIFCWLIMRKCKIFPDTNYLEYLKEFNRIKNQDETLCHMIVELQSEFSSSSPRIDKIINFVKRTSNLVKAIQKGYKNLVNKYKNPESYDIYSTYLENIINNKEEAELIIRRKAGLNVYSKKSEQSLEQYGKNTAIMLLACSAHSFGKILYLNEKTTKILKISGSGSYETFLMNFIPQPYDALHDKLMREFVKNCDTIDVQGHDNLYLKDQLGFLIECNILIKLTAFHNCLYFLISFNKIITNKQAAVISDEGFITCHSEHFPYYLKSEEKYLNNKKLSDLLPNLNFENLQENELFVCQEGTMTRKTLSISDKTINFLIIIPNENDIKNSPENQTDHSEIRDTTCENTQDLSIFSSHLDRKLQQTNYSSSIRSIDNSFIKGMSKDDKFHEEKSMSFERARALSTKSNYAKKLLSESRIRIKVLQWVLFIAILSVIGTVAAILGYMVSDVSYSTSMSSFKLIGDLLYNLGSASDMARTMDRMIFMNVSKPLLVNHMHLYENLIAELENIENHILGDFSQWSYCSAADILHDSLVPLWSFEEMPPKISYANLYNTIGKFIFHGKSLIANINNKQDYKGNSKFLVMNGLDFAYEYTDIAMKGIKKCEIVRVKSNGSIIRALLILGFCALIFLEFIIIGFIILVSIKHDEFWNFLLNNAQLSLSKLKFSSVERLMTIHGVNYNSDMKMEREKFLNKNRKVKTFLYIKYSWRIMIFFTIAASYYLLIGTFLYPNCEKSMTNRPELLSNFNLRRSLLSRLSIFSRDIYQPYIILNFPSNYSFANSYAMLYKTLDDLNLLNKEIRQNKFSSLMSQELMDSLFEKSNSSLPVLHYGTESSINTIVWDLENLAARTTLQPGDVTVAFLSQVTQIQNEIGYEFGLVDDDSKEIINNQLNIIIEVTALYSASLCVLYFLYYLPYLNGQIKLLKKFAILPTILPMNAGQVY
ncbi:unnamed protein product [Blepharisma stoltei]|uniref:TmcB/TmcC TPR repeats domain-containing protein n=1 Tax=Blepharisma stoltei TaxID=1481888 RepID=A0AAU9J259_9CILI|nr:unnamed protein product [Blepharisma stoltei]